jgi:transcriptional regulator of arginine metabolism
LERRNLILSIVKGSSVSSQDELREMLSEAGVEVTQATLSRDLKALGVVRVFHPDNGYFYACALNDVQGADAGRNTGGARETDGAPDSSRGTSDTTGAGVESDRPDRETLLRDIRDIRFSGNLAVIKTKMGYAVGVAMGIDKLNIPDVVGTVGGDDTLLVVLKENCDQRTFLRELRGRA